MKIKNPKISMLINRNYTTIEITDSDANTRLATVKLTPEQLCRILSREVYVDCECTTGDLTKIGKKYENNTFEFEIKHTNSKKDLALNCKEALIEKGMHEWEDENYYSSQNSFFTKDGKNYARTLIRRWI